MSSVEREWTACEERWSLRSCTSATRICVESTDRHCCCGHVLIGEMKLPFHGELCPGSFRCGDSYPTASVKESR